MRLEGRHAIRIGVSLALAVATFACQDSNSVTAPMGTAAPAAAQLSGAWNGTFQAYDSTRCSSSTASASFQQNGTVLTGLLKTNGCGIAGAFRGSIQGNTITGWIDMMGCQGGGVSGTVEGGRISLGIADLTKPLITGDQIVMNGGAMTLGR